MKRIIPVILILFTYLPPAAAQEDSLSVGRIVVEGRYFYVHMVLPGETMWSLGRKYGVAESDILQNNPQLVEGLRAGEAIKIPAPAPDPLPRNLRNRTTGNRRVEVHAVNRGETAYSIARRYGVSVDELVESNPGLDPIRIEIGQRILIPREALGTSTPEQIDAGFNRYTEALNEAGDVWNYHLVEKGETLYSLTRRLDIPEDSLRRFNPAELADGLKAGSILRYPAPSKPTMGRSDIIDIIRNLNDPDPSGDRPPHRFDGDRPVHVALMLPFISNGTEDPNMSEYYKGTLLALEDLKAEGVSVDLSVFDTGRSAEIVRNLLENERLADGADLIIGPRSEEEFEAAARFARRQRIPIVSPLTAVKTDNPSVFQARPGEEYEYDKLKPFLTSDYNVVLIRPSGEVDAAFLGEIEKILPVGTVRVSYAGRGSASAIRSALSRDRENVVIVPTLNENVTDAILTTISSIQNNITSTTGSAYPMQIIGSSQWARFRSIDNELFFKLRAMYVTLYYADRTDPDVAEFDRRYLSAFGTLPASLFPYRGYDVARLFVSAIHRYGDRYAESINRIDEKLLPVAYRFRRNGDGGWINDEWVLVRYQTDYTIRVQ
jgi:LysM repeat protein